MIDRDTVLVWEGPPDHREELELALATANVCYQALAKAVKRKRTAQNGSVRPRLGNRKLCGNCQQSLKGKQRKWCSDSCRVEAWRARRGK